MWTAAALLLLFGVRRFQKGFHRLAVVANGENNFPRVNVVHHLLVDVAVQVFQVRDDLLQGLQHGLLEVGAGGVEGFGKGMVVVVMTTTRTTRRTAVALHHFGLGRERFLPLHHAPLHDGSSTTTHKGFPAATAARAHVLRQRPQHGLQRQAVRLYWCWWHGGGCCLLLVGRRRLLRFPQRLFADGRHDAAHQVGDGGFAGTRRFLQYPAQGPQQAEQVGGRPPGHVGGCTNQVAEQIDRLVGGAEAVVVASSSITGLGCGGEATQAQLLQVLVEQEHLLARQPPSQIVVFVHHAGLVVVGGHHRWSIFGCGCGCVCHDDATTVLFQ